MKIMESVFGLETRTLALDAQSTTASVKIGGAALVVTGLEDATPAVLVKFRMAMHKPGAPFVIWVRDEDRDDAPLWLVSVKLPLVLLTVARPLRVLDPVW